MMSSNPSITGSFVGREPFIPPLVFESLFAVCSIVISQATPEKQCFLSSVLKNDPSRMLGAQTDVLLTNCHLKPIDGKIPRVINSVIRRHPRKESTDRC